MTTQGVGKKNSPRYIAMYLGQQLTGATLVDMARVFNVKHYSTISKTINRFVAELKTNPNLANAIRVLKHDLAT